MSVIKVAAAQYPIDFMGNWESYADKLSSIVEEATKESAGLLVFPEYASMELLSLELAVQETDLAIQLDSLQKWHPIYLSFFSQLAKKHQVYILAGSFPTRMEKHTYRNRAYLFSPEGKFYFQEKLMMTRFEKEEWFISPGDELKLFVTPFGKLGIVTCYDSEFPVLGRMLVEAGAEILLCPSCTDTMAGYNRVRISCQARALENQCYVVMSPLVGNVDWLESVDINIGAAGIFSPMDRGFPDDGVLAQGELNQPQWVYGVLDMNLLDKVRKDGQVLNHQDWEKTFAFTQLDIQLISF